MGWGGKVRELSWTVWGSQDPETHRAGRKESGSPPPPQPLWPNPSHPALFDLHFFFSLQVPPQALTTHHPQTQTPAHGRGSGSPCRASGPQHICPASGNRKPGSRKAKMQEQEMETKPQPGSGISTSWPLYDFPQRSSSHLPF